MKKSIKKLLEAKLGETDYDLYLLKRKESAKPPYAVYRTFGETKDENLALDAQLSRVMLDVDLYNKSFNEAHEEVIKRVKSIHNTQNYEQIHLIQFKNSRETYDSDTELYRTSLEFEIHFYEDLKGDK